MPNTSALLRGVSLHNALAQTKQLVKWKVSKDPMNPHMIEPAMALAIARGGIYEGKVVNGRVKWIRDVDERPEPVRDPEFWDDRSVVRHHAEQRTTVFRAGDMASIRTLGGARNRARADLWDKMLARTPAPRSWQRWEAEFVA